MICKPRRNEIIMDKKSLETFALKFPQKSNKSKQIDYFVYFLSANSDGAVTPVQVEKCFCILDIEPYSNIPKYLSDHSKRKLKNKAFFIKTTNGYRLERNRRTQIETELLGRRPSKKAIGDLGQRMILKISRRANSLSSFAQVELFREMLKRFWTRNLEFEIPQRILRPLESPKLKRRNLLKIWF